MIGLIWIVFILVDIDLFSTEPKYLITDQFMWKGFAIVIQVIFLVSIIKWEIKKKRMVQILTNGIVVLGTHHGSEYLKGGKSSGYYYHLFSYEVNGKKYEVGLRNKRRYVQSNFIIYQADHPKKAIAFEELKKGLQRFVERSII
jgi:hypothetical protein